MKEIRKATEADIKSISTIYEHIHEAEKQNKIFTGWISGVYPIEETARNALLRDDLFVYTEDGIVTASAIINKIQVDIYADCHWKYDAPADKIMVLHTLTVEPAESHKGIGKAFVDFYEDYAIKNGCTVLRMDTNAKNIIARNFYKKYGYREAGILPCVFNGIPNVQLVLLEKQLPNC